MARKRIGSSRLSEKIAVVEQDLRSQPLQNGVAVIEEVLDGFPDSFVGCHGMLVKLDLLYIRRSRLRGTGYHVLLGRVPARLEQSSSETSKHRN